jgi:CHASE2 domain-containing sensor protein
VPAPIATSRRRSRANLPEVTLRWALLAAFAVLLLVVAIVDASWVPFTVLLVVLLVGVPYAVVALTRGQSEWFDREQRRREKR